MDDARALLNSLMGNDRNAKADQRKIRKFSDAEFCKNHLIGLCPHDLFKNTKIDLGACEKEHNDIVKDEFEKDAEAAKFKRKWRGPLRTQLRRLLEGVDRRTGSNQLRIAREKEGGPAGASEEVKQQLSALKETVSEKLKAAEGAADDGKFEESRNIIKDTEATKRQIEDLEQKRYEKYKKEEICEICGLIIDAEEQEAMKTGRGWHINGKQHIGYNLIREKLKELELESSEDKKNGVRSPTPSPVRTDRDPRDSRSIVESKRRKSKSRSPARGRKTESKRRSPSRGKKKSRSPSRGKKTESKRRKSRSRSRRRKSSRSRSGSRGKAKAKKSEGKKRADSSPDKRSRSRKKKSRSKSRKARSKSKKKKSAKESSPVAKKEEGKEGKKKGSKDKDSAKADVAASKTGNADADTKAASATGGEKEKKTKEAEAIASKIDDAPAQPKPPDAPVPAPPKEPPAKEEDEGARNRKAPVFMVFRPKAKD